MTLPAVDTALDPGRYVPAYFTWIANKLSRGASQTYLARFGVGIEAWRVLVLLAIEGETTAQKACSVIGMDKASMSRCFKSLQAQGHVTMALDPSDGRARIARLTASGRAMHDRIRSVALERERAFLAVLSEAERASLIEMLRRLHENLPAVETATQDHLAQHQLAQDHSAQEFPAPARLPSAHRAPDAPAAAQPDAAHRPQPPARRRASATPSRLAAARSSPGDTP